MNPPALHIAYRTRELGLGVTRCVLPDLSVRGPADLVTESMGYIIFEDQASSGFELPSFLAAGRRYNNLAL